MIMNDSKTTGPLSQTLKDMNSNKDIKDNARGQSLSTVKFEKPLAT